MSVLDSCVLLDLPDAGMARWNELSQGKSSDEMVSILLNELAGSSADSNIPDYFDALVSLIIIDCVLSYLQAWMVN